MVVIITVLFGMFSAAMEALITATILPTIISSLGGMELYPWIINSFLLCFIVVTPIFGKMSDTHGYKKVYLVAVGIFMVSSILCGASQNMTQLIIFRGLQGIGTGGLITMSIIFFGEIFPLEKRPKMQALLSSMWAIASLLGPAIGAYLAQTLSWRWAFYINVPTTLVILIMISIFAKDTRSKEAHPPLDKKGLLLFIIGCLGFVYGLVSISQLHFSLSTIFPLILGLGFLAMFVKHSIQTSHSFIPFHLFKKKEVLTSIMLGFLGGFFLFCIANFLPMYVQGALGMTATYAGKVVTALALGSFSGSIICGVLLNRWGFRRITMMGALFIILGFSVFILTENHPGIPRIAFSAYLIGMGLSSIANASIIAAQAASPQKMIGSATSLFHFFRSFGGLIGIALMGGMQLGIFRRGLDELMKSSDKFNNLAGFVQSPQLIFDPNQRALWPTNLLATLSSILASSIYPVFYFCLGLGVITLIISMRMPKKKPADYSLAEDPIPLEE